MPPRFRGRAISEGMIMIGFRPCGVCRALVPSDTGCGHWRPRERPERSRQSGTETYLERKRQKDIERKRAARAAAREAKART